jgi:hypothetical protein
MSLPVWLEVRAPNIVPWYEDPQPGEGKYARRTNYHPGQTVSFVIGPGVELAVAVSEVF